MRHAPFVARLVTVLTLTCISHAQVTTFQSPGIELTNLIEPCGVGIDDATARIYVAERGAHRISVFDRDGTPLRTIGEFGHDEGQLDRPEDVDVGPEGRIYVADTGNHRVQVFDADGRFVRAWGTRGPRPPSFSAPSGIAVAGNVVAVSDRDNMNVQIFSLDGEFQTRMQGGLRHDDALRRPGNVCIADDGTVFAADAERDTILRFEPSGMTLQIGQWGAYPGLLASPMGVDSLGERLIVADTRNDRIQLLERDGTPVSQFNAVDAQGHGEPLTRPTDVAAGNGFIVVAEPDRQRCRVFDITSAPSRAVWSPGHSVPSDSLAAHGAHLALHDQGYETVTLFTIEGDRAIRLTDIGKRGQFIGSFIEPGGLVVEDGLVHIADTGNGWIQVYSFESRDDYDPLSAHFHRGVILQARCPQSIINDLGWLIRPDDLARDAQGQWLVLDSRNRCVFVLDADYNVIDHWTGGATQFDEPIAIITDQQRAYVLDAGRREVVVIDPDGAVQARWSLTGASTPTALAARAGQLVVADRGAGVIHRFDHDGAPLEPWPLPATHLISLASLDDDRLVGVDAATRSLVIIGADGSITTTIKPEPAGLMPDDPSFGDAPSPDEHDWIEMPTTDGNYIVRWRPSPAPIPLNEPFNIEVHVLDAATRMDPDDRVRIGVDATMPHHRHGMIDTVRLRRRGNGVFTGSNLRLHMSGSWLFTIDVERDGVIERSSCPVIMP